LSDWPLIGAAVLFLVAYSWQVLGDLHGAEWDFAESVMTLTWVLFTSTTSSGSCWPSTSSHGSVGTCWIWPWSRCPFCDRCG
jgi:hypothetical protein